MKDKRLLILLGNQLFPNDKIQESGCSQVFMAEDYELCTYEKHHKLKILMFLASMREKRDELIKSGYKVDYFDIEHSLFKKSYLTKLQTVIEKKSIQQVVLFEVEDKPFENKLLNFLEGIDVHLEVLPSPMFKLARHEFSDFKGHKNTLRMGSFYKGKHAGKFSKVAAFSAHPLKNLNGISILQILKLKVEHLREI